MTNHYKTLGIPNDANADTIKRAYRKKSGAAHPDREGGSHQAMIALNRAYDTLSDANKRQRYDQTGQDESKAVPPLDQRAMSLIMMIFAALIEQFTDQHDIIDLTKQKIREHQQAIAAKAGEFSAKAKQLEKRRKRIKYVGTERNFLLDLLDQKIAELTRNAAGMEAESRQVGDRAIVLLKDFAYEVERGAALGYSVFTVVMR